MTRSDNNPERVTLSIRDWLGFFCMIFGATATIIAAGWNFSVAVTSGLSEVRTELRAISSRVERLERESDSRRMREDRE